MLEILQPAAMMTVQDAGRRGWQAFGVPVSGPMDACAHRAANRLAGNPDGTAALEIGLTSAVLRAERDCLIAAAGAGYTLRVLGRALPLWAATVVRAGWTIELEKVDGGNWVVLAVDGGIATAPRLGSRSDYLRAPLGPDPVRPLQPGDRLPLGAPIPAALALAGRSLSAHSRPAYADEARVRVIRGPQAGRCTTDGWSTFTGAAYRVSPVSDRMGYRLDGPPVALSAADEMLSEGMARGCVQIPADGQPIVMQADCPTAGGYPRIAAVISADQPLLAQLPIGAGTVRFIETDIASAQSALRAQFAALEAGLLPAAQDEILW